jgi:hypothetical protein
MDTVHSPRGVQPRAPGILSPRIHLPVQPAKLQEPRQALLPDGATGGCHRPSPVQVHDPMCKNGATATTTCRRNLSQVNNQLLRNGPKCGVIYRFKLNNTNNIDCVAVDAVQNEPVSAQIPLNRESYREFSDIWPWIPAFHSAIMLNIQRLSTSISNSRVEQNRVCAPSSTAGQSRKGIE